MAKATKPAAPTHTPEHWQQVHGISRIEHAAVCAVGEFDGAITDAAYRVAIKKWREGVA